MLLCARFARYAVLRTATTTHARTPFALHRTQCGGVRFGHCLQYCTGRRACKGVFPLPPLVAPPSLPFAVRLGTLFLNEGGTRDNPLSASYTRRKPARLVPLRYEKAQAFSAYAFQFSPLAL